ncbi:Glutathione S-transferase [Cognatiyoonia koreensis]|uniref:Glutathione S-transferase n=1 Tax=Cognatiyoonia koreensis TaxID=364200 RepID=A0A1I0RRV2_9RHOB|nr:glutathione S-transferase [Cognatiyoonia koreensis]SEW44038.1 Glutathione S-transferase [Cognatiyoonia koreensis]
MQPTPILWSFRRCPYAMRARLAVQSAGIRTEIREILLKEKPAAFLKASQSGTVPALEADETLDESRDIMVWALRQHDPDRWLDMPDAGHALIDTNDGPFKAALDHTKYAVRFPDLDPEQERAKASTFLTDLNDRLAHNTYLFKASPALADMAILPFVRQFANTDRAWFDAQAWPHLIRWLDTFLESTALKKIMAKYPPWQPGQTPVHFP